MATDSGVVVSQEVEQRIEEYGLDEQRAQAYRILYAAMPEDTVLWADRSQPMTVDSAYQRDDETRVLLVEKPRADGTYEIREKREKGTIRLTSPIGRANNLHFVDRGDGARRLSEPEVERLVDRLSENAVDAYMRQDYQDWSAAVADVVEDWSERVSLRSWQGYRYDTWQDGDPEAIFESVAEILTSSVDRETAADMAIRERAEVALVDRVVAEGLQQAESSLVDSPGDYRQLVDRLAHHVIDRIEQKSYADAHVAVRDTVSNWIDEREPIVYQSVLEYGGEPPGAGNAMYDEFSDPDEMARERAFDTLQADVWQEVKAIRRDESSHDPTLRGMTTQSYDETVDYLAGETLKRWSNDGFLRTTARDVVAEWADSVEGQSWDGHRYETWQAGDVEDIFASAAVHSSSNPMTLNPFSDSKERSMAVQAILSDVVTLAQDIYDKDQPESEPVPIDDYLQNVLGTDTTYGELKSAQPEEVEEVTERVQEAATGEEVGWTFVDEILESGGTVPEVTNNWVLIDYGVLREGDEQRKLAWFDRSTGDVLVLSGVAAATPRELGDVEEPYLTFHVTHHAYSDREPDFVCTNVTLSEALECVYEFVDATKADIRIIETKERDYVSEQITHEDINASGVIDKLVPNLPFGTGDLLTAAADRSRGAAKFTIRDWAPEMAQMSAYTAVAVAPRWLGDRLDGIQVEPQLDSDKGVGTNVSKEFGSEEYKAGVGGEAEVDLYVRPSTFTTLNERYTPDKLSNAISNIMDTGDVGKGAARTVGETISPGRGIRSSNEKQLPTQIQRDINDGKVNTAVGEPLTDDALKYFPPDLQKEAADALANGTPEMEPKHLQALADAGPFNISSDVYNGDYYKYNEDDVDEQWEKLGNKLYGESNRAWASNDELEQVERQGYADLLMDEYLGSADSFFKILRKGYSKESGEAFDWDEFEKRDIPISGMLMRGLDAETLVDGVEYFDVRDWLDSSYTFVGGDYETTRGEPPSFEEWRQERYGPGNPPGPEREARMYAQYHREVNSPTDVDPYEALGVDEQMASGDYDASDRPDDGFGNSFDDVAERVAEERDEMEAAEFERSVDGVE